MPGFRFLRETVVALGWASHLNHHDLGIFLAMRSTSLLAAAIVLCAVFQPAAVAITINMEYYNEGDPVPHDENPMWDPDGTILKAHFQAAKSIWESLLPGSGDVSFTFEWDDDINDPPGTLGRTTPGPNTQTLNDLIEIYPNATWFVDPTPGSDEEFGASTQVLYSGLTAAQRTTYFPYSAPPVGLEVGFKRAGTAVAGVNGVAANIGFDLLTVILHEMGHVLGVNSDTSDPYLFNPQHVGGLAGVAVLNDNDSGHLAGDGDLPVLMCNNCANMNERVLPSATDVLAIAKVLDINNVRLQRVGRIGSGNWNNTNSWIGADVPDATQDAYVNQAGLVTLDVNASVKSLVVDGGSGVDAAGFQLSSAGDLRFDGGAISVGAGGAVSADAISGDPATLTTAAGSTIQFNNFTEGASSATAATFNGSVTIGVGSSTDDVTFNPNAITDWTIGQNLSVGSSRKAKLVVDDGTWSVGGNLSVPRGGEVVVDGGTLGITGSANIGGALTYKSQNASNTTYTINGGSAVKTTIPPSPTFLKLFSGGQMTFDSTSPATPVTAASATINVGGGTGDGGAGGVVTFKGNSSADHAQFWTTAGIGGDSLRISNPVVIAGTGGRVIFADDSKANFAHFRNDGVAAHGPSDSGGSTYFRNNSNANNATFDNYGSTLASYSGAVPAPGGRTEFFETASAGTATFNNYPGQGMGSLGAGVTIFHGNSTAAYGTFSNKGGQPGLQFGGSVEFYDTATAGNAYFYNEESPSQSDGSNSAGNVRFYGSSTAGNAKFYNQVGGGAVFFNDSSTAGDASFVIEDTATGTFYGHVVFNGNSKGGTSDIAIKENCFSATVEFRGSANAEQAEIKLVDGSQAGVWVYNSSSLGQANVDIGSGSNMLFRDSASAGNSTIRLRPGSSATFSNSTTTAANATFNIDGATVSNGGTGGLSFDGGSAGDAIINVNAGTASGAAGGQLRFGFSTSAGNATINAGAGLAGAGGGRVSLSSSTDATNARITIGANGSLDLFGFGDPTIGSLDVAGSIFLGQTGLRIGALNTSNTISGPIGGYSGNGNARLTKVGTGTLTLTGANTYYGLTKVDGGTLMQNGTAPGAAEVNSGATLKGTGSFGGTVTVNSGGTLAPGASPGKITVGGLTLTSDSTLAMELGGTTAGTQYDQVISTGAFSLAGALNVSLTNGFTPLAGQSFNLFDWGTVSGSFSTLSLPTLSNTLGWNTSQLYTSGVLSIASADYNQNNSVDAADYILWRKTNGVPAGYDLWRGHFGESFGSGTSSAPVPEPSTAFLLAMAAFLTLWPSRQRCR